MESQKTPAKVTAWGMSTVRSRLPRQLMWAILIGLISFGLAVLVNH